MDIKYGKKRWSLCVILTSNVGVDSCGTIGVLDVINKLIVTNDAGGRIGIKDYSTEGNEDFWLI